MTLHFDAGRFHPDAGSLLPGPLAATRTGLTPVGDDELQTESDHFTIGVTPSGPWAYSPELVEVEVAVPHLSPAEW